MKETLVWLSRHGKAGHSWIVYAELLTQFIPKYIQLIAWLIIQEITISKLNTIICIHSSLYIFNINKSKQKLIIEAYPKHKMCPRLTNEDSRQYHSQQRVTKQTTKWRQTMNITISLLKSTTTAVDKTMKRDWVTYFASPASLVTCKTSPTFSPFKT